MVRQNETHTQREMELGGTRVTCSLSILIYGLPCLFFRCCQTLGVDFVVKSVKIPESDNTLVELYLIDTSGSPIYKDIRANYWAGTSLVMAVYDVTNRDSFTNLNNWLVEVKKSMPFNAQKKSTQMQGILVATKCDQNEFAQVTNQEALALAHQHGLAFFETSAATGKDVDVPFTFIAAKFHEFYSIKLKEVEDSID